MKRSFIIFIISLFPLIFLNAGTTGKLTGLITDEGTCEPLPFVNITIEGTTIGAATDIDGKYVILNITPGKYSKGANFSSVTSGTAVAMVYYKYTIDRSA